MLHSDTVPHSYTDLSQGTTAFCLFSGSMLTCSQTDRPAVNFGVTAESSKGKVRKAWLDGKS